MSLFVFSLVDEEKKKVESVNADDVVHFSSVDLVRVRR